MHRRPPPTPLIPGASSSSSSPSPHDSRDVSVAEHAPRPTGPESSTQPSTSGSGSSLSKLLQIPPGNVASFHPHARTPDTPLTTPSLEYSAGAEQSKHVPCAADADFFSSIPSTSPSLSSSPPPPPPPSVQGTQSSASISSSSNEQLPTRASIRAWAKATPAGPPRNTPSPTRSAHLLQSSSDERLDRRSITRSMGDPIDSSLSGSGGSGSRTGSRAASGATSADEDNSSRNSLSLGGDVTDIESAGSRSPSAADASDASDPSPSLPTSSLPTNHQPFGPPSQSSQSQSQSQSSESDSPPPALVVSHTHRQNQQDRLDRRHQRHLPAHPGRRRERHRDRRSRTSPNNPTVAQTQTQAGRVVPEVRAWLPPPPPPLPPLRPLQLMTGGFDVLDEISRMLHNSQRPILRAMDHDDGDRRYAQRRCDDVLDDICYMITMSRSSN